MRSLTSLGRLTTLLGRHQAATGQRWSLRRLAAAADVSKDFVYRLDAGQARHVDLQALARLCEALHCRLDEILIWEEEPNGHHGQPV